MSQRADEADAYGVKRSLLILRTIAITTAETTPPQNVRTNPGEKSEPTSIDPTITRGRQRQTFGECLSPARLQQMKRGKPDLQKREWLGINDSMTNSAMPAAVKRATVVTSCSREHVGIYGCMKPNRRNRIRRMPRAMRYHTNSIAEFRERYLRSQAIAR